MNVDTNTLNPSGSIELNLFSWEIPENLPEQEFKYEKPKKVLENIPSEMAELVQKMIDEVQKYDSRSVVVDYKVRNLKAGDTGSKIYGYHLDCCNDIHDDFEPETHILFGTVQGTSFIMNPINVSIYDTVDDVIKNEVLLESICATNTAHKYTSKVLHNCPIIEHDCQRVLIRVTAGFKERIKNAKAKQHQV
ncbi:hypothetical protein pEaSNUABM50_00155 [Erwinia phage pEa_SNUABM_50]|uniref:Uncharacterized protein n=4 Tax=Eneladusvirus BF TaxID=2560751 RepID=A0A7L8ZNB3_9CAUD|nr:hypothetical protein FDH34_gp157 [Serratia phage BF]QOI71095.1 hypothetical protein pEaSNUABM12_00157 [Erwinia phage pEa_SNUABM_12]QOI71640.1 hypothetical protein pEaSNUABM47_00156 [Erwinia phage pEa_SNUABM_47]QOI72179.1 hypothetical protein pEaSNUABM50_00155 [Erwinia phage pEa_SNUABM_50]QXO11305.1 hypothetical protein pEaSNUABM19_00159 [Erwinia phage pEa_SNUABM_19]QXO11853.1 hypothetical protein pEaSNUABM44_00157 [Erwinia phage pEa_SNUABM_44]QXO12405.1 hypothetical protein pEaSNUABM49_001